MKPKIYAKLIDNPINGFDTDKKLVSLLKPNKFYEVTGINIGSWITYVTLVGEDAEFNSVNLDFFDESKKEIDIFAMPEFNPYL